MKPDGSKPISAAGLLPKCPTGIQGLDEITGGGLPRGRPTLVLGTERAASGILRQADAKVAASTRSKPRNERRN